MENTTLNQVLNAIQTVSENHAQVNGYDFGEFSDIAASKQEKYALVWSNVLPSNIVQKTTELNIEIWVMDIQKDDMKNEKDTLSDTFEIALDIYAMLTNPVYQDMFVVDYNVPLEVIREGLPDKVNGWKMNLKFQLVNLRNRCQVPTNN